jgi:hypothetical protein
MAAGPTQSWTWEPAMFKMENRGLRQIEAVMDGARDAPAAGSR